METVQESLRSKNIRPSIQRVRILDYLKTRKNHPTVDTIYTDLFPQIPTLSRTTVYNTLEMLKENGLVISLDFGDGSLHYDADTSPHIHFECEKCKHIYDVFVAPDDIKKKLPAGFSLSRTQLYAFGTCAKCDKNAK
ncbi:MAG: transcriptional repressor [Fibrobacteraceae bacterium]